MKFSILKQEARFSIKEHKGIVFGTTILFSLISLMFSLCLNLSTTEDGTLTGTGLAIFAVMILVTIPLACGVINTIVQISNNKKSSATEFINFSIKNFGKICKILLRIIVDALIISAIAFVIILAILLFLITVVKLEETSVRITSIVLSLIYTVILVIRLLPYSFCFFILSENNDKKAKEIITESKKLMKGNLVAFIILTLSFIGWYLLITVLVNVVYYLAAINKIPDILYVLSTYISTIFLTPYMTATQYAYYEDLLSDKSNTKKEDVKEAK